MKGYMIFIEGKDAPTMVHATHKSATHEMYRLAKLTPDCEITLFRIERRITHKQDAAAAESLGSHMPDLLQLHRAYIRYAIFRSHRIIYWLRTCV